MSAHTIIFNIYGYAEQSHDPENSSSYKYKYSLTHSGLVESSGQSQWELVSVVENKQRGSHLRPDRLRLQNVDIVDKVRSTVSLSTVVLSI